MRKIHTHLFKKQKESTGRVENDIKLSNHLAVLDAQVSEYKEGIGPSLIRRG
jgi:hypothetical protein